MSVSRTNLCLSDSSKIFNIAFINVCTEAEGPFKRMAIWFQGCDIRCPGCCNPELQEFKPAHIISLENIIDIALNSKAKNDIEGVTFLGGEPTMQNDLPYLAQAFRNNGLGVILFTGRNLCELNDDLISNTDLIIDGIFDKEHIDSQRNLIGSVNQVIHYISDRYLNSTGWFEKQRNKRVEINMVQDSGFFISGDVV